VELVEPTNTHGAAADPTILRTVKPAPVTRPVITADLKFNYYEKANQKTQPW